VKIIREQFLEPHRYYLPSTVRSLALTHYRDATGQFPGSSDEDDRDLSLARRQGHGARPSHGQQTRAAPQADGKRRRRA
jgi:hypothetical protein